MSDRHPCALLVHFRRHDEGTVLAAIGDLLIDQLDDWGWTTDWTHPFLTKPRVGLWVFEGVLIPDDEDLDFQGKWRRPTPEELGRLTEGVPVWESEEGLAMAGCDLGACDHLLRIEVAPGVHLSDLTTLPALEELMPDGGAIAPWDPVEDAALPPGVTPVVTTPGLAYGSVQAVIRSGRTGEELVMVLRTPDAPALRRGGARG